MSVKRFNYEEGAKIKINLKPILNNAIIGLEDFVVKIKNEYPSHINRYLASLRDKYEGLIEEPVSNRFMDAVEEIISKFEDHDPPFKVISPSFLKLSVKAFLSILKFDGYSFPFTDEEQDWDTTDLIRAMKVFDYYQVASLQNIMSKEKAIKFVKYYIETTLEGLRNPENYYKNIEAIIDRFSTNYSRWRSQDVAIKIDENKKALTRVSRCKWAEVMKGFDSELAYAMICNTDFKNLTILNENFVLTRTQTLMQGGKYCDFCFHDKRVDNGLEHPSKREFESL